jgi:regulator of protease activity HflC (stomatin/prohibitin superfamily)
MARTFEEQEQERRDRQQREYDAERERLRARVKFIAKIVGSVFVGIIALSLLLGSFFTVDQGEMAVITRFGAVVDVAGPGLHGKLPWISHVERLSVRTESRTWIREIDGNKVNDSTLQSYSHDQQSASISIKVTYRLKTDPVSVQEMYSTYRHLDTFADRVIIPRTAQGVKTVFGQYTAARVIQERAKFNIDVDAEVRRAIEGGLEGKTSPVVIEAVTISNIDFSDAYEHAIEQRMKAEVEVAQVAQNLERERKTAEIVVVQAKAKADAQLAEARAQAEATRIQGEAEAKAIRARSEALQSNPALVSLTLAEKWNGVLPTTMVPGGSVPFIGVK